jgi:hypothetical protein
VDVPDVLITPPQLRKLQAIFTEHNIDRDMRLRISSRIVDRDVGSAKELTLQEAGVLIDTLERLAEADDFKGALQELVDATDEAAVQEGQPIGPGQIEAMIEEEDRADGGEAEQPTLGGDDG